MKNFPKQKLHKAIKQDLSFQKIDIWGANFHSKGVTSDLYRRLKRSRIAYFWLSWNKK